MMLCRHCLFDSGPSHSIMSLIFSTVFTLRGLHHMRSWVSRIRLGSGGSASVLHVHVENSHYADTACSTQARAISHRWFFFPVHLNSHSLRFELSETRLGGGSTSAFCRQFMYKHPSCRHCLFDSGLSRDFFVPFFIDLSLTNSNSTLT
jgi:hypothetical protein